MALRSSNTQMALTTSDSDDVRPIGLSNTFESESSSAWTQLTTRGSKEALASRAGLRSMPQPRRIGPTDGRMACTAPSIAQLD
jgi:hypothetical protein